MKFKVNNDCIGCGLCNMTCPEIFEMNGDKAMALDIDATGDIEDKATDALNGCPVAAIEII